MKRILIGLTAAALLTGCASETEISLSDLSHIHNISTDGNFVYAGTHEGLYRFNDGWQQLGDSFDVMGFTINEGEFLASGHPGPNFDFPDPLGLLASADQGESWNSLGLTGEVDFHYMRASGDTLIGVAANLGQIIQTTNGGLDWQIIATPPLNDLAINPANSQQVVLVSEGKLLLTDPLIAATEVIATPVAVEKVVWFDRGMLISSAGNLYLAENLGDEFEKLDVEFDSIVDVTATSELIAIRDHEGIHQSLNLGKSFSLISELESGDDH